MKNHCPPIQLRASFTIVLLLATSLFAPAQVQQHKKKKQPVNDFSWKNTESDLAGVARHFDPHLANPWGIAVLNSILFVADNGTGVATAYNPDGTQATATLNGPHVINIPRSASDTGTANPTGAVTNPFAGFNVTKNGSSQPSSLLFVSEDGVISGWNPALDPNNAVIAVDNGASNAIYKGAALGTSAAKNILYVANFHSGKVEMYSDTFQRVDTTSTFVDPNLPADYAPFNVLNRGGQIFVAYAVQDAAQKDEIAGVGNGLIDVYDSAGTFLRRLITGGNLNAPWGMEILSVKFGGLANGGLFVGNFGDGMINVYDPTSGTFLGILKQPDRTHLAFDGLWALVFDNNQLYFTAGIADEAHGLLGFIFPANTNNQ
jgi:uncharacterized protein (TIGR03118 family)